MAKTVQKHFKCADNNVVAAHDGVRVFPISWSTLSQEKNTQDLTTLVD